MLGVAWVRGGDWESRCADWKCRAFLTLQSLGTLAGLVAYPHLGLWLRVGLNKQYILIYSIACATNWSNCILPGSEVVLLSLIHI